MTDRLNWTELNWGSWNQPLMYTEGQTYTHSYSIRKWTTVLRNGFLLLSFPLYWELLILLLKLCGALKIQLYWNFQKQLLTIVVMLPLDPWIHSAHRTSTLYTSTSPYFPKPLPLLTTILLSVSVYLTFIDSTCKRGHAGFVFFSSFFWVLHLHLISLSLLSSRFILIVANGTIFFLKVSDTPLFI